MNRLLPIGLVAASCLAACDRQPSPDVAADTTAVFTSERFTVVTQGSGPDVILIPGLASPREVWDSVAPRITDRYRVHLIQVNGFAGSPPGANASGPVSAPVAEDIARYIRESGLTKPALVGHSMGGSIGMMVAARHPDLVGRLMVVDMYPFLGEMFGPPGTTLETVRPIADSMRAGMLAATPDSFVAGFGQMIANMTNREDRRPVLLQNVRISDRSTVANAFHELMTTDLRPELPRITVPVVVLYVIPPGVPMTREQFEAAMRAAYGGIPNVRLTLIPESRHFIQFDQPDRMVAEVDSLMRRPVP